MLWLATDLFPDIKRMNMYMEEVRDFANVKVVQDTRLLGNKGIWQNYAQAHREESEDVGPVLLLCLVTC